ncbi:hypothetical protein KEF85_05920 [Methylomonas paludis]|uniref:Uncharacterized protein n=1 Tax=Methylomonas paludis TaxID=1173101 RepID=A0A975RB75_9GAMM|nr:hypothetical protein [Methylomonas paludis]QWF71991.1 hypothetical protein KEF85_05920 [Methylomonas paludis]
MAKYLVLEESFIAGGLVQAGAVIEFDAKAHGKPGANLQLVVEKLPKRPASKAVDAALPEGGDAGGGQGEGGNLPGADDLVQQTVLK